jgi:hypothetical protein
MSLPRAVVLGFTQKEHAALGDVFDLAYIISDTPNADYQWQDLNYLRKPLERPSGLALNDGTLEAVSQKYMRFVDINSRRFVLIPEPESETYNAFVACFYAAHNILTSIKPDVVLFQNLPHEGCNYIFYCLARTLNIRIIATYQTIIPGRFWICENLETLGEVADAPRLFDVEPTDYQLPKTWPYMTGATKDQSYQLKSAIADVIRKPWRLPVAAIRYHYSKLYRLDLKRTLSTFNESDRFVYFPLHLQPELTTAALGGPDGRYSDQISAIEQLSQIVPPGIWIYVKENPKQTAQQRGQLFYRRLNSLPNVKYVSREVASRVLIEKSIAVATITGTAGWEALFYGKPVLVFGNAWYLSFDGVSRFYPGLKWEEWISNRPGTPAQIAAALDVLMTITGKGLVDLSYSDTLENFDVEQNALHVATSLARYWSSTAKQDQGR